MGRREDHLRAIIQSEYTLVEPAETPGEELFRVLEQSPYNSVIIEMYGDKGLEGVLSDYPRRPGNWDISIQKGFRIELDEGQHFNRYREITLNSRVYEKEKIFSPEQLEEYKGFCAEYERKCPKRKGWWSNASTNTQFGQASPDGDFSGNGSSRWKQRAFNDFLKDVASRVEGKPLIRVSVYDTVCVNGTERRVGNILRSERYMDYKQEIINLIEKRLEWWRG